MCYNNWLNCYCSYSGTTGGGRSTSGATGGRGGGGGGVLDNDIADIQVDESQVPDIDIDHIAYVVARTLCCVSHKYLLCCPLGCFSSLPNSI